MSSSRKPSHSSTSPEDQINLYFDSLFGDQSGIAALTFGVKGTNTPVGSYRWCPQNRYYLWPGQREEIVAKALRMRETHDVYIVPNLRSRRDRRKGSCLGSLYCWADIDGVTHLAQDRLKILFARGSFVVHSGQPGHLHVYIRLSTFCSPVVIEDLNKRLAHYLGADSKWHENALLRLPGTQNFKGRAAGGEPYPVVLENVGDWDIDPWSPATLETLLGPLPERSRAPRKRVAGNRKRESAGSRRGAAPIVPVEPAPLPDDLPDDIRRRLRFPITSRKVGDASRSGMLHGFVGYAMSEGYSDSQIMAMTIFHEPAQDRWPNENDLRREIQRCTNKLRPQHPHVGFSCAQAGCAGDLNLSRKIDEIQAYFRAHFRAGTLSTDAKVMEAFLQRAREIGSLELGISRRDLGQRASIGGPNTITDAVHRLEAAGYLRKRRLRTGKPFLVGNGPISSRSHRYQIKIPNDGEPLDSACDGMKDDDEVDKPVSLVHIGGVGGVGSRGTEKNPEKDDQIGRELMINEQDDRPGVKDVKHKRESRVALDLRVATLRAHAAFDCARIV